MKGAIGRIMEGLIEGLIPSLTEDLTEGPTECLILIKTQGHLRLDLTRYLFCLE